MSLLPCIYFAEGYSRTPGLSSGQFNLRYLRRSEAKTARRELAVTFFGLLSPCSRAIRGGEVGRIGEAPSTSLTIRRNTRSLLSGAHSRDPLAIAPYAV